MSFPGAAGRLFADGVPARCGEKGNPIPADLAPPKPRSGGASGSPTLMNVTPCPEWTLCHRAHNGADVTSAPAALRTRTVRNMHIAYVHCAGNSTQPRLLTISVLIRDQPAGIGTLSIPDGRVGD